MGPAALLLLACSAPSGDDARPVPADTAEATEASAARREMEAVVRGMNAAIDSWDGPAYVAPLDSTPAMIFIGSDASEVSLGWDAIAPDIIEGFAQARQGARSGASYRHAGLTVGATADGEAAWWVQSMRYGFEHEGEAREYPFRISGFALRDGTDLDVVLAHAALPVDDRRLQRLVRPGKPQRAAPVTAPRGLDEAHEADSAAGLRVLVEELASRYNSGDVGRWVELFADEPDVVLAAAGPEEVYAGRAAVAEFLRTFASGGRDPGTLAQDTLVLRTRGDHGWWYESGRLLFEGEGEPTQLPWRSTGGAVRAPDGTWRVLLWHGDVPVPNDSTAAFSDPAPAAAPVDTGAAVPPPAEAPASPSPPQAAPSSPPAG